MRTIGNLAPQFTIRQGMIAVALVALTTMCLGNSASAALLVLVVVLAIPVVWTPRGKRLRSAAWVASLYPLLPLLALYGLWLAEWWYVGHRPSYLDDPMRHFGQAAVSAMFAILLLGLPISTLAGLTLTAVSAQLTSEEHRGPAKDMAPPIGMVLAWLFVIAMLVLDPLGVFDWFSA